MSYSFYSPYGKATATSYTTADWSNSSTAYSGWWVAEEQADITAAAAQASADPVADAEQAIADHDPSGGLGNGQSPHEGFGPDMAADDPMDAIATPGVDEPEFDNDPFSGQSELMEMTDEDWGNVVDGVTLMASGGATVVLGGLVASLSGPLPEPVTKTAGGGLIVVGGALAGNGATMVAQEISENIREEVFGWEDSSSGKKDPKKGDSKDPDDPETEEPDLVFEEDEGTTIYVDPADDPDGDEGNGDDPSPDDGEDAEGDGSSDPREPEQEDDGTVLVFTEDDATLPPSEDGSGGGGIDPDQVDDIEERQEQNSSTGSGTMLPPEDGDGAAAGPFGTEPDVADDDLDPWIIPSDTTADISEAQVAVIVEGMWASSSTGAGAMTPINEDVDLTNPFTDGDLHPSQPMDPTGGGETFVADDMFM